MQHIKKLIRPLKKNAPKSQEAISTSGIPARRPTESMIAVGPVTANRNPTNPTVA